jgi:TonB family protein
MHAVLAAAAALALWPADEAGADHLSTTYSRMYAAPSQQVWRAARELLTELGLGTDKRSEEDQLIVTKWAPFDAKKRPDLPATERSDGLRPERFQLHVYVSPTVEPARVHLGSEVEYRKPSPPGLASPWAIGYRVGTVEEWFFGKLEAKVGQSGRAVPRQPTERARLAGTLLGDAAGPCLSSLAAKSPPGELVRPQKIGASEVEFRYPAADRKSGREGKVVAEFQVSEDGAVHDERVVGDVPSDELRTAVLGAVSLLRYRPVRSGGCPWPFTMTYTVNFKLR